MRINQAVRVPAKRADVWDLLGDIPRVATCMPGAELTKAVDSATYEGTATVSIGPLTMNYAGTVTVLDRDETTHALVLRAAGRDRRGGGTATAEVTARLAEDDGHTRIEVASDLRLTGRVAALGRGVQDVATKLFEEFAGRLATELSAADTSTDGVRDTATPVARAGDPPADDDVLRVWPMVRNVLRERLAKLLIGLGEKVHP